MSKRNQAELSANLIAVKGSAAPATNEPVPLPIAHKPAKEAEAPANVSPLNFRVTPSFRRKFKTAAAANDLSLIDLLYQSFDAWSREQAAKGSSAK